MDHQEFTPRQKEILAAALALAAHGGIQQLTVKNLAQEVGVTEPALYRHFKSKNEIIVAMIHSFEEEAEAVFVRPKNGGIEALLQFARARFVLVAKKPDLAKVLFAEEMFMNDPEQSKILLDMMHRHRDRVAVYFREAQEQGEIRKDLDPNLLFRLMFGPIRLIIKQWGMSGQAFHLVREGEKLLCALREILRPVPLEK